MPPAAAASQSRSPTSGASSPRLRYDASEGAVVGHNQGRFFNRPLYIANADVFALAGDRPIVRFGGGELLYGTFLIGVVRGRAASWLHDCSDVKMEYRPAHVRWIVRDRKFRQLVVTLDVYALEEQAGFAARMSATGTRRGDCLVWAHGGVKRWPKKPLHWEMDPHVTPPIAPAWFDPAFCAGNRVTRDAATFTLASDDLAPHVIRLTCDAGEIGEPCAASAVADPRALLREFRRGLAGRRRGPGKGAVIAGSVELVDRAPVSWLVTRDEANSAVTHQHPEAAVAAGQGRSTRLAQAIVVETPDARLNAMGACVAAALDGAWYPPTFRHGAMLWNVPYIGWRTTCGGTAAGWHDRVKRMAKYYFGHQLVQSEHRSFEADAALLLTQPAKTSRFYGRGRIVQDQGIYNMQSQFFDQMVHAWRWTGDEELATWLRPALELHLEWLRECFDADNDGLYESFINTWPSDSVWYAGGAGAEETSYAYNAHVAARDLAERAGDSAAAVRHRQRADQIRAAFQQRLWVRSEGHSGLYVENSGLRRLHNDPWLYSLFLPVDAGLVDSLQAAESLLYAERSLQNDRMAAGGRRVWTSNFVPAVWSVREVWPGDNYHLALAYFQAGLNADGWDVFRGAFLDSMFDNTVPGDLGHRAGGTDFGDCVHMAARALVEGLFGYAPDRPNGIVRITPRFPETWERANLHTGDVKLAWRRRGAVLSLEVELAQPSALEIRLPVCARGVTTLTVDGRPVRWQAEPSFGQTLIKVRVETTSRASVEVKLRGARNAFSTLRVAGKSGDAVRLSVPSAKLQSVSDPQRVLGPGATVKNNRIVGELHGSGDHTIFAAVKFGDLPQWRRIHLAIADPAAARVKAQRQLARPSAGADWATIDLSAAFNGDIRTIYAQSYVSPRPATISAQIGTDGYSPWTFPYWETKAPNLALDRVPKLLRGRKAPLLRTPQGVPFAWNGEKRNVAFTSHWDNWPREAKVSVGRAADAVWFLVCGSTNPMQGRIANAILRLRYADGEEDALELVPPFNYWNLCEIRPKTLAAGQWSRCDYTSTLDAYSVPKPWPETVQLGENCRAVLLNLRLRPKQVLESVTLETLSSEVVVGLMGVTLMNPR